MADPHDSPATEADVLARTTAAADADAAERRRRMNADLDLLKADLRGRRENRSGDASSHAPLAELAQAFDRSPEAAVVLQAVRSGFDLVFGQKTAEALSKHHTHEQNLQLIGLVWMEMALAKLEAKLQDKFGPKPPGRSAIEGPAEKPHAEPAEAVRRAAAMAKEEVQWVFKEMGAKTGTRLATPEDFAEAARFYEQSAAVKEAIELLKKAKPDPEGRTRLATPEDLADAQKFAAHLAKELQDFRQTHPDVKAAGALLETLMRHGDARSIREALHRSWQELQSAHLAPQAAMRDVAGWSPANTVTAAMPKESHYSMDEVWKQVFQNWPRKGEKAIPVEDAFKIVETSIRATPHLTEAEKDSLVRRMWDEMFHEQRLHGQDVRRPWAPR